jgi:intracellular septation protein
VTQEPGIKPAPKAAAAPESAGILIDLGPLVLFLISYWMFGVFVATSIFMLATAAALLWSKIKIGKISTLLFFSGVMVLLFGGLTLLLHDESFIKMKPTLYYLMVSGILFFGVYSGRPTLKAVMETAYPGLRDSGWQILTRNFAWFFIAMAIANEIVWRNSSTGFWLGYKLWGALPATLIFGMANVPMILRHSDEDVDDAP